MNKAWFFPAARRRLWLPILAYLVLCGGLRAQSSTGLVVGINGHRLVVVNLETGALTPYRQLQGLPVGAELRNLVFVPRDTAFYTTMNFRTRPELLKIRATGSWESLGVLTAERGTLHFCEALTYDENTDRLYLSGSLDGAIPEDKKSEALLIVDRRSARCALAATLRPNVPPDDFDEIALFDGKLFGLDGVPGRNTTYIYPFSPTQFDGRELFAGTKQNIPYFTMDDVVVIGQFLYFPDHKTQGWYYFDLLARRWHQIGRLHGPAELGAIKLTGLAYYPLFRA